MRTFQQTRFLVRVRTPIAFHEFVHEGTREEAEERALECAYPNGEIAQPFAIRIRPIVTVH